MSTTESKTDVEVVFTALAEKRRLDAETAKRIHERASALHRKFDSEVSVESLRSIRDHA
jgi:hypothetical protein